MTPFTNELAINDPTPAISKRRSRWRKNRDFVEGQDAVKARGEEYLPKVREDDTSAEYAAHLKRTNFYPASAKICQGLSGLVFRKQPQLRTTSARVQLLTSAITIEGHSLDDVAEWFVTETQTTNFSGSLIDHPEAKDFQNLSAANDIEQGYRPYLLAYSAENILEVRQGVVGQLVKKTRVRLLERDGDRVRELILNGKGEYEVRIWDKGAGDAFTLTSSVVPKRDGRALDYIPFELISTSDKLDPQPAILDYCVDLNLQHYCASGVRASIEHLTSAPIAVLTGFDPGQKPDGEDKKVEWDVSPGAVWEFKDPNVKVEWFTYKPEGASLNAATLEDLTQQLSTIGHSILAPEKAAPEAPEMGMIRRAAENATLAAFTRTVSRKLEKQLQEFARWADPSSADTLGYSLNEDFIPARMTAQEQTANLANWQAGGISHDTYLLNLRDGGVVSPELDIEAEKARIELDTADRPQVL